MERKRDRQKLFIKGKMDVAFLVIVLVILSIGLIMLFSASYPNAYYYKHNSLHFISRQLLFAVLGVCGMLFISKLNYKLLIPLSIPIYGITLLLLVIVLFMRPISGAKRWIVIADAITFQPSEVAKFAVVILFSVMACRFGEKMKTLKYGIGAFALVLSPIVFLMLLEPHLSGTVLICLLAAEMMFLGGTHKGWFIGGAIGVGLIAAAIVIYPDSLEIIAHYADDRIRIWLDPESDPLHGGFQTLQSLYTIGSGGLMGTGIAGSRQKYLFLPEPQNDFIFPVVCEELGFVGAVIVILLFVMLLWRGFVIAVKCPNKFGSLIAAGFVSQVGIQTILNIAVVTNTIPNTGISLPFFSYGGTSLLMLLCQMGIILSVSRTSTMDKG